MTHTESDLDAAIEVEAIRTTRRPDRRGAVGADDHRRRRLHLRGLRPRRAGQAVAQGVAAGRPRRGDPRGRQLSDLRHPRRLDHRRAHRTRIEFAAHHNVCMHRGRRLVDTPDGAKNACGRARKSFVCGFHGWTYGLDGACTHIREQDDWKGALTPQNTHLAPVQVDTWGGWLFINMDPDCEPLADYLFPAAKILDPFGLENMRYKWRKWLNFDCNWKVAMEAFNETYHVFTTHPEFNKFGEFKGWAKAQGRHSNIGYDAPKGMDETKSKIRLGTGDPRISTAEMQVYTMEETNATTTQTLVNAAKRLVDELPEGTPADKVLQHWLASARRDDEARGVVWPTIPPDILGQSGTAWQIFPNFQIGQGLTSALCYRRAPRSELRPEQVHLRGRGVRALPERPRAADGMAVHAEGRARTGCRCCRRTSRTWPPCSRA